MAEKKFDLSIILKLIDQATAPLRGFSSKMTKVGKQLASVGKGVTTGLSLPLAALGAFGLKSSIDIESAFTGVQKTVNATTEELAALKKQLEGLSLKIPIPVTELLGVAEAAGQLGIETKNIPAFTEVMAKLGATTNLASRDAADQLARFANITGLSQDKFDRLGSVIVALGNNMATTEAEIVSMAKRLAGAGTTVGLSETQILSLAASLSSVGLFAEQGGSAFSVALKTIDKEIGTGSKLMENFAIVAGKSTEAFETAWKKDAAGSIIDFVTGLKRMQSEGTNVNQVLDELGFEGIRISDALLRAAGANDKFRKAQELGKKAWAENTALTKEANLRFGTTASQIILMNNNLKLTAATFGDIMIPVLKKIMEFLNPVIEGFRDLDTNTKELILTIAAVGVVGGPFLIGLGLIATAFGAINIPAAALAISIAAISTALAILITDSDNTKKSLEGIRDFVPDIIFGTGQEDRLRKQRRALLETINPEAAKRSLLDFATPTTGETITQRALREQAATTEITINVKADPGTQSRIGAVRSSGNPNARPIVNNNSSLGSITDIGGIGFIGQ